jgi:hypothetical protein
LNEVDLKSLQKQDLSQAMLSLKGQENENNGRKTIGY